MELIRNVGKQINLTLGEIKDSKGYEIRQVGGDGVIRGIAQPLKIDAGTLALGAIHTYSTGAARNAGLYSKKTKIAEALPSEAAFTRFTDKKPIVATYDASSCIAVGGYEATNGIAFVAHFSTAREVRASTGKIFYNIARLAKKKIEKPIQLHLRGGKPGYSEGIIDAIKMWKEVRKDLPMEIASEDILNSRSKGGLSIDSRNGRVSEYKPVAIATYIFQHVEKPEKLLLEAFRVLKDERITYIPTGFYPGINIAYRPEEQ